MERKENSHKGLKTLKYLGDLFLILGVIAIIVQIFSDISHQFTTKLVLPQLFLLVAIFLYLIFNILIKNKKAILIDIVIFIFILLVIIF